MTDRDAASIGPDDRPARAAHVAWVELDGEAVLYDEETEALHVLNPTATVVWSVLDGEVSLAELAGELAEAYGLEIDEVTGQVVDLTRQLGGQGLLDGIARAEPEPAATDDPADETADETTAETDLGEDPPARAAAPIDPISDPSADVDTPQYLVEPPSS